MVVPFSLGWGHSGWGGSSLDGGTDPLSITKLKASLITT